MSSAVPSASGQQRIVIHHLSDLHYQQDVRGKDNPLVQYSGYLERLGPSQRPNLIIITGDVTFNGVRGELSTVAEILRHNFPAWAAELSDHIFVVPGPRDLNWEGNVSPGLKTFYTAFSDFGLPAVNHVVPPSGTTVRTALNAVIYPVDTCYSLEDCREEMKAQFHEYGDTYEQFVRQYRRTGRSASGIFGRHDTRSELADLRERYLHLAEANDLMLVDAGRVREDDLKAFKEWVAAQGFGLRPQVVGSEPLKILVTHHPLAVLQEYGQQDQKKASKRSRREDTPFGLLAREAGKAGFHLALHGHIHKPQVLSDLSLLQDADAQHPLRQVGAGSLGDGGTFNEITATYVNDSKLNHWRLEIRTINLKAQNPHEAATFVLLNRTEDAAKRAEELDREKTRREEFDRRVRAVMRQYSEAVYRTTPNLNPDKPGTTQLPQLPMQGIESIIRDIVFPGFGLRVRLFLKEKQHTRLIPKLNAAYLNPPPGDGTGLVAYPMSLAGLSLLLGRYVVYPWELDLPLTTDDDQWLKRSGKDRDLVKVMEALIMETQATSYPGPQETQRVQIALDKLNKGTAQQLMVNDFYRQAVSPSVQQTYPEFICVPFPKRPEGGVVPDMPEVAVLVVSVKPPEKTAERPQSAIAIEQQKDDFTPERIAMLESLAELAGMFLVNSSALREPLGIWDERIRI